MYSEYYPEEEERAMKILLLSTLILLTGVVVAQEYPTVPQPEGDFQYLILLLLLFLGWIAHLGFRVWSTNRDTSIDKVKDSEEKHIISQLQLMEVKFESMVGDIKNALLTDHRLLKQTVDSLQRELHDFKKEVRSKGKLNDED